MRVLASKPCFALFPGVGEIGDLHGSLQRLLDLDDNQFIYLDYLVTSNLSQVGRSVYVEFVL